MTGERSRARAALGAAKARAINRVLTVLPPRLSVQIQYLRAHHRPLNLRRPTRFTEKIQLIKLYGGLTAHSEWADKVSVKPRVAAILGDDWIIPTLWHGPALPPRPERTWTTPYLIKANLGSKWNLHVDSDVDKDWTRIEKTCARWLCTPWLPHLLEGQYSGFPRQLLVEPRIGDRAALPVDYKFWVFGKRVEYVWAGVDRLSALKFITFDRDWNRQPFTYSYYPQVPDRDLKRPKHFLQMREAAETLGRHFPFASIDFYDLPEGPKFGEITLTPASGFKRFTPDEYDMQVGALLDLDAASIPPR